VFLLTPQKTFASIFLQQHSTSTWDAVQNDGLETFSCNTPGDGARQARAASDVAQEQFLWLPRHDHALDRRATLKTGVLCSRLTSVAFSCPAAIGLLD